MRRARGGATLIELVVVLALLGIVALLVAPRIDSPVATRAVGWRRVEEVRRLVLLSGRDSTFLLDEAGVVTVVTVYSDGAVREQSRRVP